MIASLALAVYDKSGTRHKEGDIICVKEYIDPPRWGNVARSYCVIVNLDIGDNINFEKAKRNLMMPVLTDVILAPTVDYENVMLKKFRFGIKMQYIVDEHPAFADSVQWSRVADPEDEYQPFWNQVFPVSKVKRLIHDYKFDDKLSDETIGHIING